MRKKDKRQNGIGISLPLPSSSDLRGKQSVRATFKLTEEAINTVSIVATHLGIKQKSLFDHLIEDAKSLSLIADRIQTDTFVRLNRVQKTYVLSRKTMACLGEASKKFDAPRDALVEYSIQRLLPIIIEEREKHKKRKQILGEIREYVRQGEVLLKKCSALLEEDDPVYDKFRTAMASCRNAHDDIQSFVEKGNMIEDFEVI
jgi:hypothetical protein